MTNKKEMKKKVSYALREFLKAVSDNGFHRACEVTCHDYFS